MSNYQRLKKRIEDQHKLLDQEREMKKKMEEKPNKRMEEDAPDRLPLFDFWCDTCQEDFSMPCYKSRHRLYGDTIVVWRATCPDCETDCIRHITHKDEDLYYDKSTKIRKQRNQYAWEALQPDQYGFRTHYGEPYKEFMRKCQDREKMIIEEERSEGLKGLSLERKQKLRKLYRG